MRIGRFLLGLFLATSLSACGTIMDGGSQTVDVVVKGSPTAACTFMNSKFKNFGHFPNKMVLERSREDLQADCTGEQNRHIAFVVPSTATGHGGVGNIATGIVPGVAYDNATGAMWEYPNPVIVDFREIGEGPKPAWPQDKTVPAVPFIARPKPIGMTPIMDEDLNPALPARVTAEPVSRVNSIQIVDTVSIAHDAIMIGNPRPMKPVVSVEDKMGADPAIVKARAAAKAKAAQKAADDKAEAARKARANALAKKAEAEAAQKAAAEAAKPAETLPEAEATAPAAEETPTASEAPAATPVEAEPATSGPTQLTTPEGDASDIDEYLKEDGQ